MAFVFKTERPSFGITKQQNPGPGQYDIPNKTVEPNLTSFLTSEQRTLNSYVPGSIAPGPGTYNAPTSVQGFNPQSKTFYSALNSNMESLEEKTESSTFKSMTKRSNLAKISEIPGPGTYYKEASKSHRVLGSTQNTMRKEQNKDNEKGFMKAAVPSIPSNVHSFGYSEKADKQLMLNNNPLLEIQKYVGPGYYDAEVQSARPQGAAWHKSTTLRSNSIGVITGLGPRLGPGSYKVKPRGGLPLYKLKSSAAFSSKSARMISDVASNKSKQKKKAPKNLMEEQLDEFREDGEPGPGYYHNATSASFNPSSKPSHLQCFNSGSERFGDTYAEASTRGPGRYNVRPDFGKKINAPPDTKLPFVGSEKRFVDKTEPVPGPGNYDIKSKIEETTMSKTMGASIESFGATVPRFRLPGEEVPGPGAYHKHGQISKSFREYEDSTKVSSMFASTSKREGITVPKDYVPAPGTYDVGKFNVANKVKSSEIEDPDLIPIKYPFSSATQRFDLAPKIVEEDKDDASFEEDWNPDSHTRGDLILKVRNQPKATGAFTSRTNRVGYYANAKEKGIIPGPGKYYGPNQNAWVKKTYNVNFTTD